MLDGFGHFRFYRPQADAGRMKQSHQTSIEVTAARRPLAEPTSMAQLGLALSGDLLGVDIVAVAVDQMTGED
jgi:hypothetical protein